MCRFESHYNTQTKQPLITSFYRYKWLNNTILESSPSVAATKFCNMHCGDENYN